MEMVESVVPEQLRSEQFRFVKLKRKSKIPFEKNWQNKPYTFEQINEWIKQGSNYGVLGGCGDLIIIDSDNEELYQLIKEKLPETFTVKTPKKGFHSYLICIGVERKIVLVKDGVHFGEIISHGSQVVGAGSIHPDTGTKYEVVGNFPIAQVSNELVFDVLKPYIHSQQESQLESSQHYKGLVQKYGKPYYATEEGVVSSINQSFWAGLHKAENIEIFEPDEKTFYRYNGENGLYSEISEDVVKQEISNRLLEVSRQNNIPALESKRTISTLNNIVAHLKGISEKRYAFKYKKKDFIHLKNGVLKIYDNKRIDLVPFSSEFYSRNQSPIEFDAGAKCDKFLNEFLYPAVSPQDAVLIQKYAGLCVLGDNLIQRFLILGGDAGRGKSQLSLILQELVGSQNVTELRTQHLKERFELYRYRKKTLLVGVDVPANFLTQKGTYVLKGLTGGDCFDTERKGSTGSFQIKGNFCIVMTSNSKLRVRLEGDVGAWRRRLLIVDYNLRPPKKKIPNFGSQLVKQEGSGILNWALKGLDMVWDDIERIGDIAIEDNQENRIEALLAESDSLRNFLNEEVVFSPDDDLSVNELVEAYANYCPKKGWNPKPITVICKELEELMLELFGKARANSISRNGKSNRGFRGVALKTKADD
jgi:P4 family phage/plasmid primase-like protien